MKPGRDLLIALLAFCAIAGAASAQTCPNTNPEADDQMGCPDPFYATVSSPAVNLGVIEFNVTVKNRRIAFVPDCDLGEQFCYDNINYQGLPLCTAQAWSGKLADVKLELASCYPDCDIQCYPDCDFNVTINPPVSKSIENEKSQNFTVRIDPFRTMGEYDFTFRSLLSSVKKRMFSLRLSISKQPAGMEGDNKACPACASEKCDAEGFVCGRSCTTAVFCSEPGCSFDTASWAAAEACCGDDSGEMLGQCSKTAEIGWDCTSKAACCGGSQECTYDGNCYSEGGHLVTEGEDKYAYCQKGTWYDCDGSQAGCSAAGLLWNNSQCCGDDSYEYYLPRICFSGCETNVTDKACCSGGSTCVYNGQCYATGDVIVLAKKNVTCEGSVWSEKPANQTVCYRGECNKKNRCEGACPGCIFKDFSCYGTNCEPDFRDPDAHWTYCGNCSLNWSYEDKRCCGDDEKEFWVPPCPDVDAEWACCSNPSERVNSEGECAISCGTGISLDTAELDQSQIPFTVSLRPEAVDIEAGKSAELQVAVRTDGTRPLHGLVLDMCGPFTFQVSPQVIEELKPGETLNFSVKMSASADSIPGTVDFAAYVGSSELMRQRYTPGLVNISAASYPSFDFYITIAFAAVAVIAAKKFLSRGSGGKAEKGGKGSRDAGRKLAQLVREELGKGTPEKKLRKVLASNGIARSDR